MALGRVATDSHQSPCAPVLAKLASLAPLSAHEIALVSSVSGSVRAHHAGAELGLENEMVGRPRVLLSGWACRTRLFEDGRRQIFHILLPGDAIGVCSGPTPRALSATIALTPVKVADAQVLADAFNHGAAATPALHEALHLSAGLEQASLLDQIARLGRQTAYERTTHLLMELHWRLGLAGLADGARFPLPLTQATLADTLGLSIVHVNRTLQQLRRDDMLDWALGFCELQNTEALAGISGFHSTTPSLYHTLG